MSDAGKVSQALMAGPFAVPTLGLTGEQDGCVFADVLEASMRAADFPGSLRIERIAGADHFLHREAAEQVNSQLVCWMRRH